MFGFLSFSSGSCGNCYFLTDGSMGILIDAGVSLRKVRKTLLENGYGLSCIRAILVTHDHADHIRHLGSFCKRLRVPVYATSILHDALERNIFTNEYVGQCRRELPDEGPCEVAPGVEVRWFEVPHDATQTVGYMIDWGGRRLVLMTDIGRMTKEGLEYARTADTVIVESNYDLPMLLSGKYTQELKMRICQGHGHLSNDECAETIGEIWHRGLRNIFLCHLSENNNTPAKAFESAADALRHIHLDDGLTAKEVTNVQILPRGIPTRLFEL